MQTKAIQFVYNINRMLAVDLIATIHIDDKNTRFIELLLRDHDLPVLVDGCTATARFVTKDKILLHDSVPCIAEGSTVRIPIDAAAVRAQACDLRIEVSLSVGEQVLTLPFPLWVRVRGSILDNAETSPDSEGSIPEQLRQFRQDLTRFENDTIIEKAFDVLDSALTGNPSTAPSLYVTQNQQGHYQLVFMDSLDELHTVFDFSQLPASQGEKGDKGDKGDTGATGPQGPAGNDYILTATDRQTIAQIAMDGLNGNGVAY